MRNRNNKLRREAIARKERYIERAIFGSSLLSILIAIGIFVVLLWGSLPFFSEVSLTEFFGGTKWTPLFHDKHFGIWPLVTGTLLTSAVAITMALPFSLLASIYLSELAPRKHRQLFKPIIEILAGIPTIVYGYFALLIVTPWLQQWIPDLAGFSSLSAGICMGIMIMPMLITLSEDALRAVPSELREGSYALGANKFTTVTKIVLPSAISGIGSAILLSISRALGETMIVAIAAGQKPNLTFDPRESVETMTAYIVQVSMGDTPTGTVEYRTIFAVGLTLFGLTLIMNLCSYYLKQKFQNKYASL